MPRNIIIIGGGISGLSVAYALEKKFKNQNEAVSITLLEESSRLGGLLFTQERNDFVYEYGPDCFISDKAAGINLGRELGLESEFIQTRPEFRRSYIYANKKLMPVPEGLYLLAPSSFWPFVTSPLLSFKGKLRAGMDLILPRKSNTSDESLSSFVSRRLGREMLERVAQPMVAGIYTADPEELSLQATMPQFLEMEKRYRSVILGLRKRRDAASASGPRYSLFVSFRKGMGQFVETLANHLECTNILYQEHVNSVERQGQTWNVATSKSSYKADELIIAMSGPRTAAILKPNFGSLADSLQGIPYASSAIATLTFKKESLGKTFDGAGFVLPAKEVKTLIACSFLSNKFLGRAPSDDYVIVRCFIGGRMHENVMNKPDAELLAGCISDLSPILNLKGDPIDTTLHRWNHSMPQYTLGHLQRVADIQAQASALPHFRLIGNAYRGVGIPDVISYAQSIV